MMNMKIQLHNPKQNVNEIGVSIQIQKNGLKIPEFVIEKMALNTTVYKNNVLTVVSV